MRTHKAARLFATTGSLAVIAAGLGACGGSSPSTSSSGTASAPQTTDTGKAVATRLESPPKPLTRTELIAKGDAVCARIDARAQSTEIGSKPSDYPNHLRPLILFEREELTQLEALTPPASLKRDWGKIVAARKVAVEALEKLLAAGESPSTFRTANKPLRAAERSEAAAHRIARRDGFKSCGA